MDRGPACKLRQPVHDFIAGSDVWRLAATPPRFLLGFPRHGPERGPSQRWSSPGERRREAGLGDWRASRALLERN
jgi:hypothetical protein